MKKEYEVDFQSKDFRKMLIPVNEIPNKGNFIANTVLDKFPEFHQPIHNLNKNKIIKWIACVYDKESPFVIKFDDLNERKFAALEWCDLDIRNASKNNQKLLKIILKNRNKAVNKMIVSYVRAHNNSKYALCKGLEKQYYDELEMIQNGGVKRGVNIYNTQKRLESAMTDLLSGDRNTELEAELHASITFENLRRLRPEGIAQLLMEGEDPISEEEIYESK